MSPTLLWLCLFVPGLDDPGVIYSRQKPTLAKAYFGESLLWRKPTLAKAYSRNWREPTLVCRELASMGALPLLI